MAEIEKAERRKRPDGAEVRDPALITSLQGYELAKERAGRSNRNLLQYGAAIATVLGIGAGSGGIFALANSVAETRGATTALPDWALGTLLVEGVVIGTLVLLLLLLLVGAFYRRRSAEHDADLHLATLIAIDPERYWPEET